MTLRYTQGVGVRMDDVGFVRTCVVDPRGSIGLAAAPLTEYVRERDQPRCKNRHVGFMYMFVSPIKIGSDEV